MLSKQVDGFGQAVRDPKSKESTRFRNPRP